MMRTIVMSVGGSLISPDQIDKKFIDSFRNLILELKDFRFIIVAGGGKTCRNYVDAAKELGVSEDVEHDWIGIMATKLNAELMRTVFGKEAYEKVVANPTEKIKTNKRIIIGAGWEPGASSDIDAVLLAENFKADTVINMSNVDYVYDKDPNKFDDATKITEISWDEFKKIVGDKWIPSANVIFDPTASKKAAELGLKVVILNGNKLDNLKNFLEGKKFAGSLIS